MFTLNILMAIYIIIFYIHLLAVCVCVCDITAVLVNCSYLLCKYSLIYKYKSVENISKQPLPAASGQLRLFDAVQFIRVCGSIFTPYNYGSLDNAGPKCFFILWILVAILTL